LRTGGQKRKTGDDFREKKIIDKGDKREVEERP
jgi:hypothetical protein